MNYFDIEEKYILQTYKRQKIVFDHGRGKYLWDKKGKKYLDFFSGLSVCNLGHCHPEIIKAVQRQIKKYFHTSNIYYIPEQIELAKLIIEKSFKKGKVFFSNSGAEANECAIKLARKYGSKKGKFEIISFENSFHGRTLATLSATGQTKFHRGFSPLPTGFNYAKFNDIDSVKKLITKKTVAVIVEPVQGEGGVYPAEKKFLEELRQLCNKNKLLLIFDEVQCGMGRTGSLFAYQHYGVEPDMFTLAKSIANGLPLGVTVVKEKYSDVFEKGDHGSTFGGNPVSCAAAIETIKQIDDPFLMKNVSELGKYFIQKLIDLKNKFPEKIKEVRGVGLMVGLELFEKGNEIVEKCADANPLGIIINCTQEKVLRFLPPFLITKKDIDYVVKTLENILS